MIVTEQLTLRRVTTDDWESIKEIWEDQKCSPYARYDRPCDTDPETVRARIEKWASTAGSTEHMFFAVCLEEAVIGYIAFHRRENGYETGYCFHSGYHEKGYAKESLAALLSYVRTLCPGAAVTAGTALANTPSVRLLFSLGFQQTGTERLSFYKDAAGNDIWFEGGIFVWDGPSSALPLLPEKE